MGQADFYESGDYNAACFECGRKRKASTLKKNWQGYWVCPEHWEPRQPQDFVRGATDQVSVPWAQPQTDEYAQYTEEYTWYEYPTGTVPATTIQIDTTAGATEPLIVTVEAGIVIESLTIEDLVGGTPATGVVINNSGGIVELVDSGSNATVQGTGIVGGTPESLQVTLPDGWGKNTPAEVTVTALDAFGNPVTSFTGNIQIAQESGSGTLSGTLTQAAVGGTATFTDLSYTGADDLQLEVSAPDWPSITIVITAPIPVSEVYLRFQEQPPDQEESVVLYPYPTVIAETVDGIFLPGFNRSVTTALVSNPGSATLYGTLTRAPVAGVITFDDLRIFIVNTNYTLSGNAAGTTGTISDPFDIYAIPTPPTPYRQWRYTALRPWGGSGLSGIDAGIWVMQQSISFTSSYVGYTVTGPGSQIGAGLWQWPVFKAGGAFTAMNGLFRDVT